MIRLATPDDAPALNDIYNAYVLRSLCTMQTEPSTLQERQDWLASATEALVFEEGGRVLGWGALVPYSPRAGYRLTVENSVYVREGFHRRGIGSRLLAELIARGTARGLHSIVAKIASTENTSLRLHAKAGFVEAGRLREAGQKFGQWLDVVFLQRML